MTKVHCQTCGLYLGSTKEEDFPVQITCPICEETARDLRHSLANGTPDYDVAPAWIDSAVERHLEDNGACMFVRLILEGAENSHFDMPPLWLKNGVAK